MRPQVFWALYVFCFSYIMVYTFSDSLVLLAQWVDVELLILVLQATALTLLLTVGLYLLRRFRNG